MWEEEGLDKEVVAAMGPVAMDDGRLEHQWHEKTYSTGERPTRRLECDEGAMRDRSLMTRNFLECGRDTVTEHCMRRERHDGPRGGPR